MTEMSLTLNPLRCVSHSGLCPDMALMTRPQRRQAGKVGINKVHRGPVPLSISPGHNATIDV